MTTLIVTHNSAEVLPKALEKYQAQSIPCHLTVIDSGSENTDYLKKLDSQNTVIVGKDLGFAAANNLGIHKTIDTDYFCFLNPDAFLAPDYLEKGIQFLQDNPKCAAVSGILYGYDIKTNTPKNTLDSTGIFRTAYGRWHDRSQGQGGPIPQGPEPVPALCAAALICRKEALVSIQLPNGDFFDSSFFMYKEDIDLSLRFKKVGWELYIHPKMIAHHCRGWDRSKMPRNLRLLSAKNELRIQQQQKNLVPILYSTCKYLAVRLLDL